MLILYYLLAQTVKLEAVEHSAALRLETNRYGHFMVDKEGTAFHWSLTGKLLFELNRPKKSANAIYPIPGGYAVTWFNVPKRRYGIDVVTPFGEVVQELPEYLSLWYFELAGRLYGSAMIWAPGETQIVPIDHFGGRLKPSKARKDVFDPGSLGALMDVDFKRVWATENDDGFVAATPLDPVLYFFQNDKLIKKTTLPIPWKSYTLPYARSGMDDRPTYYRSFNRLSYFGATSESWVVGVELLDGKTTRIYWFSGEKVLRYVDIPGWAGKGQRLSGSDGLRAWIFDPDSLSVKAP